MVGKWTNEPCNGVDEVVNTFWVLTCRPRLEFVRRCSSVATNFYSRMSVKEVQNTINLPLEEGERVETDIILLCMLSRVF